MAHGQNGSRFNWGAFLLLCGIYLVVAFLWDTAWVLPIKLLVVFLHEISHGLAAIATGGRIVEIQLQQEQGGHCYTVGGHDVLIYSAGYLGSMLFGVALLLVSTRRRWERPAAWVMGVMLIGIAALFVPWEQNSFGKVFGMLAGAVLLASASLPPIVPATILRVIAITSCLYAILDIKSDVLDATGFESDAHRLEQLTNVSATVWGIGWIVVSLLVTGAAAVLAVTKRRNPPAVDSAGKSTGRRTRRTK